MSVDCTLSMLLYPVISITDTNSGKSKLRSLAAKYLQIIDPVTFSAAVLKDIYPNASNQFFYELLQQGLISPVQLVPTYVGEYRQLNTYLDLPYLYLLGYTRSKGKPILQSKDKTVWSEFKTILEKFIETGWQYIQKNKYQMTNQLTVLAPKFNSPKASIYAIRLDIVITHSQMFIMLNYDANKETTLYDLILGMQNVYMNLSNLNIGIIVSIGELSLNLQDSNSTSEYNFEPVCVFKPIELETPKNLRLLYRYFAYTPEVFLGNLLQAGALALNDKIDAQILAARKSLKFKE